VPGAGHFVADEQPAELWRHIQEFITASPARTPATSQRPGDSPRPAG